MIDLVSTTCTNKVMTKIIIGRERILSKPLLYNVCHSQHAVVKRWFVQTLLNNLLHANKNAIYELISCKNKEEYGSIAKMQWLRLTGVDLAFFNTTFFRVLCITNYSPVFSDYYLI